MFISLYKNQKIKKHLKFKKNKIIKDSILSMVVPYYNTYLINRADKNLGVDKKLFQYATSIGLIGIETAFLTAFNNSNCV